MEELFLLAKTQGGAFDSYRKQMQITKLATCLCLRWQIFNIISTPLCRTMTVPRQQTTMAQYLTLVFETIKVQETKRKPGLHIIKDIKA
jgi:hypothetical protein